ncbi:MAG TPA: hypothetical protein PKA58_37915, partial [Polyangium sp.]|nr:hypothetical protein [Polyangium sp.]
MRTSLKLRLADAVVSCAVTAAMAFVVGCAEGGKVDASSTSTSGGDGGRAGDGGAAGTGGMGGAGG